MVRQHWKTIVAIVAVVTICVAASIVAYARFHPSQTAITLAGGSRTTPASSAFGSPHPGGLPTPYPICTGYDYAKGCYGGPIPGATPYFNNYYPGYCYGYGCGTTGYGQPAVGYGYGPPRAGSPSGLGAASQCSDPSTVDVYSYSICPGGIYITCVYNAFSPVCNQQLSDGTRCGGYSPQVGCIQSQLSCRLPVFGGGPGSGGFIQFPKGDYTPDPSSNVSPPSATSPYGGYNASYDRAASRWVPAPKELVSPDGSRYAYVDQDGAVHSVEVSTSADKKITSSGSWRPLAYETDGVYAVPAGTAPGLWQLTLTAEPKQVTTTGYWSAVGSGAAYGTISASYPAGVTNQLLRLDLQTGASTDWFERQGSFSSVVGIDTSGSAIILASAQNAYPSPELWLSTGRGAGVKLAVGLYVSGSTYSDEYGLWVSASGQYQTGLYLLTTVKDSGGSRHAIFDRVSTIGAQIAGTCG